ncbi:MAG TPA: N-acetylmuramoyl-L-alanine amidase-like domain-containing protein [Bacteroidota bacterium]|nr:N-acetylmuramoyl-L-alanine amidase-like domain-containing protein [Bacteroidota bacterium]
MIRYLPVFFLLIIVCYSFIDGQQQTVAIADQIFISAAKQNLKGRAIGDVMTFVGKQFTGSAYEANTLDRSSAEMLVCNLATFDCVTFVENVLALACCIKQNRYDYNAYRRELQTIRYRNGIIAGYASRLHYFSDWIYDNERKGIIVDVTKKTGGVPYQKHIDFMTQHRSSYPPLADDSVFQHVSACEDSINTRQRWYVPKSNVKEVEGTISSGDIIAITTVRAGLDISHTGIAIRLADGSLHLLHAPDAGKTVTISKETLPEYLKHHAEQTGIMVLRANSP